MAFQRYAVDVVLRKQVALALPALYLELPEVAFENKFLEFGIGFQGNLYYFGLAIGICGEVRDTASRFALRKVVLTVVCY